MPKKERIKIAIISLPGQILKSMGWRLIGGLAVAAGFLFFFGWLAEEVFEGETKLFDDTVRNYIHAFASPSLTSWMIFCSFLGSPLFLSIAGTIFIAVFLFLKRIRAVILFLIAMIGEIVLNLALKPYFGRTRPAAFFDYPLPTSFGFPSGHALGSLCFYGILVWLTAAKVSRRALKTAFFTAASMLVFSIGFSRIYLGVHYPSDVLAGYAAGLFWVGVVTQTDIHLQTKKPVDASR